MEPKMRLLLVYPEIQSSVTNTATYSLPLGLGSLATYCRRIFGEGLSIKILDGSMMSHQDQKVELERFQADVVGFSPTLASQGNAYELAELAHDLGAVVLFGGVNSTNLWRQMLTNRNFIQAVVLFEGEEAMAEILSRWQNGKRHDELFSDIANVAYRRQDNEVIGPARIRVIPLAELPDIDYSLFDLAPFFVQTVSRGFGRAISYYAGKGCAKRSLAALLPVYDAAEYRAKVQSMRTCSFCGRNELGYRCLPPDHERRLLHQLYDEFGVRGFFNVQDTVNLNCEELIGLDDAWFRLFIGAESITPENIRRLEARYGPKLILQAGVEAATPEMRRSLGKSPLNEKDLFDKVELMERKRIQLHASFILGGRNEITASMSATTKMARRLADHSNVTWILISPQLILPGSPDYRQLLEQPGMLDKWGKADLIDLPEIHRDFLHFFAPGLTRNGILEEIQSTFSDIKQTSSRAVLDVKGVMPPEEEFIQPRRGYCG
jgi:radical SAM superfamily enzyme YgiQ (UPF0313 family)